MANLGGTGEISSAHINGALDAALSAPSMREVREGDQAAKHLRQFGEHVRNAALGYIYNQEFKQPSSAKLPMVDAIKLLHLVSTPGWALEDEANNTMLEGGEFRSDYVQFGDKIAPAPKDVPNLMTIFATKLETLIGECPAQDADILATWAYTVFTAIHPFRDGNGRAGRSLAEYVRYSVAN